jgi:cell division protein ZapA
MRRVKINVLNNEYFIKTDADEDYVREIANYVEEKIMEDFPNAGAVTVPRPFLLATLKVADDYFRLKREFEEFKNRAEEGSRRLVEILDNSLREEETYSGRRETQQKEV